LFEFAPAVLLLPMIKHALCDVISAAELCRVALAAHELFHYIAFEFQAETSLIPHGKILSPFDYTLTLPDLPDIPNLKCLASGVCSKTTMAKSATWDCVLRLTSIRR